MTGRARSGIRRLTIWVALVALLSTIAAPAAGARPDDRDEKGRHEQGRAPGDRDDGGRAGAGDVDDRDGDPTSNASGDRSGATSSDDGGAGDGSERGLDKFQGSGDDAGSSVADMTITVGCYSVEVTSSKDISHVEVTFADGTTVKFEGLSGNSYSNSFSLPVVSAHAKSGTTIVTDTVSGDCSAVAPPTTCPDGSPMPADGICEQADGTIIELCPDGSEMPVGANCGDGIPCPDDTTMDEEGNCLEDDVGGRADTILCPDGSEMPAGANCGDGIPCPDDTTMDEEGNCLEDDVRAGAADRPCPVNPIMGVVLPVLCGDDDTDPSEPAGGAASPDDNPTAAEDDVEDSVLGTRIEARAPSGAGAPAVTAAAVASAPEVDSAALPTTGADLVAFLVLALMLIAIGGLSWRGRRSDP